MTTVFVEAVVIATEGSAVHVPLNLHQKILGDTLLVPVNAGNSFQICPPVSLTVSVIFDALRCPIIMTRSPCCIDAGGVTATVADDNEAVGASAGLAELLK